jgi:hypothetical protein
MEKIEIEERSRRVANKERCKHNMVFEYCAHCNVIEVPRDYKFPLEGYNEETGEEYTAWIRGTTIDKHYYHYRTSNPKSTPKVTPKRYKQRSVDSAIKPDPIYRRR